VAAVEKRRIAEYREARSRRQPRPWAGFVKKHSLAQHDTAIRVLFHFERLREHGVFKKDPVQPADVTFTGAIRGWQDKRSDEPGFQAAHALPCQIVVRAWTPDWLVPGNQLWRLECIRQWGKTTIVPGIVNMVDSFTEAADLKEAFVRNVRQVLLDGKSVREAYADLRQARSQRLERLIEQKFANVGVSLEELVETDTGLVVPRSCLSDSLCDEEMIEVAKELAGRQEEAASEVEQTDYSGFNAGVDAAIEDGGARPRKANPRRLAPLGRRGESGARPTRLAGLSKLRPLPRQDGPAVARCRRRGTERMRSGSAMRSPSSGTTSRRPPPPAWRTAHEVARVTSVDRRRIGPALLSLRLGESKHAGGVGVLPHPGTVPGIASAWRPLPPLPPLLSAARPGIHCNAASSSRRPRRRVTFFSSSGRWAAPAAAPRQATRYGEPPANPPGAKALCPPQRAGSGKPAPAAVGPPSCRRPAAAASRTRSNAAAHRPLPALSRWPVFG
jgi:hypothetical protein